jgi:transposase
VRAAGQAGRQVLLAPPRRAKRFLQSQNPRAKTDKIDSRGLALFGLCCPLADYPVKEAPVEQLDQLLCARRLLATTIAKFQQQQNELTQTRTVTAGALSALQADLKAVDKQIAALTKTTPAFAVVQDLQEVPGVGPVTAAMVVSRLTAKQFTSYDQFVAYCGLDIGVRQSGRHQGKTGLTKQGDAELRRLLFLAARANLRCKDSPFKQQYQRELGKGLSKMSALCAVARKLAKVLWSLHKHGTAYDAARVGARPTPKATAETPPDTQTEPA